jgi:glycosyltransferase involved in cell wall biosynthesis
LKITYFTRGGGGCDWYRVISPLDTVARLGLAKVARVHRGDDQGKITAAMGADIYVFPRPGEPHACGLVEDLKKHGKVVVEFDDDIFEVDPFSPHYEDHGLENVRVTLPDGQETDLWKDGVNINLARNRENLDAARECIRRADLVTVTTERLAERYRELNPNVTVLPNCVDLTRWRRLPLQRKRSDEIRMGWFGGASHYQDWTLLEPVLPEVMRKEPRLTLVIMGKKFNGTLKKIPPERIEFHEWEVPQAYPYKAAICDLDFGIIPLRDTPFNRCKSPIKWLELAALQVPAVTSYVPPYSDAAPESAGLFVENNDPGAWEEAILTMAQDRLARARYGAEARTHVAKNFDVEKNAYRWVEAYRRVLDGKPVIEGQPNDIPLGLVS